MADDSEVGLEPSVVRARLLEELAHLPADEHLAALAAVNRRDVEIVLTDRATITIVVAERWQFTMPVAGAETDAGDR